MMTLASFAMMAQACAPQVAVNTLAAVAQVESLRDPLVIGVNGPRRSSLRFTSMAGAVERAETLLRDGYSIDLGLMQINSRNLGPLGLSLTSAFEPCANLHAGARLLAQAYLREASGPAPLDNALSRYNTGDPQRGRRNGYVASVHRAAAQIVPDIAAPVPSSPADAPAPAAVVLRAVPDEAPRPASPPLDVFARPPRALVTWSAGVASAAAPTLPNSGDPS